MDVPRGRDIMVLVLFALLSIGATSSQDYAPNSILVRHAPGITPQAVPRGVRPARNIGSQGLRRYDITDGSTVEQKLAELRNMPGVLYAEKNWRVHTNVATAAAVQPNDPEYWQQWHFDKVSAPQAWRTTTGSEKVRVCIIDTGADATHPDLHISRGYNVLDNLRPTDFYDGNGHGTHVAGIISALSNNKIGVAGMAWQADIAVCRFIDSSGYGYLDGAISCLVKCREDAKADITSNSWGGGAYSQALRDEIKACEDAGQLFIAAAGNESADNDKEARNKSSEIGYPGNYDLASIISVAATDRNDRLADFSNWGRVTVDLAAPGTDILSTWNYGRYALSSGTSMATPIVTGAAVLVQAVAMAAGQRLTALQIKDVLLRSVDKIPGLQVASSGRLNVSRALEMVMPVSKAMTNARVSTYTLRQSLYVSTSLGCKVWASRSREAYRRAAANVTGLAQSSISTPRCQCAVSGRLRIILQAATGRVSLSRAKAQSQALNSAVAGSLFWQRVRAVAAGSLQPSKGDGYCVVGQTMPCPPASIKQRCTAKQLSG